MATSIPTQEAGPPARSSKPARRGAHRRRSDGDRGELARFLTDRAATGECAPWVDFVNGARLALDGPYGLDDPVALWRRVRAPVLDTLTLLGLTATVERTDEMLPLDRHEADRAGLVRVTRADVDRARTLPPVPGPGLESYRRRMTELFGFEPDGGQAPTLRGFVGQVGPAGGAHDVRAATADLLAPGPDGQLVVAGTTETWHEYRPAWVDHAHTWRDRWGDPVLTVEPYSFDAAEIVADVAGLALLLDGPHAGVWDPAATLLVWRFDPNADVPPAEHRPRLWSDATRGWASAR